MANPRHVEIVKQGKDAIDQWRDKNKDIVLDLSGADLRGLDLKEVNLSGADLSEANLDNAEMFSANLRDANLTGTSLRSTKMLRADLVSAKLVNANLENTTLVTANLNSANLEGATLIGVNLERARMFGVNLQGASLAETNMNAVAIKKSALDLVKMEGVTLADVEWIDEAAEKDVVTLKLEGLSSETSMDSMKLTVNPPARQSETDSSELEEHSHGFILRNFHNSDTRLVIISGGPSSGKTRLAKIYTDWATSSKIFDQVFWISDSSVNSHGYLASQLMDELNITYPKVETSDQLDEYVSSVLGASKSLIVVDDFQNEGGIDFIANLLKLSDNLKVLILSRYENLETMDINDVARFSLGGELQSSDEIERPWRTHEDGLPTKDALDELSPIAMLALSIRCALRVQPLIVYVKGDISVECKKETLLLHHYLQKSLVSGPDNSALKLNVTIDGHTYPSAFLAVQHAVRASAETRLIQAPKGYISLQSSYATYEAARKEAGNNGGYAESIFHDFTLLQKMDSNDWIDCSSTGPLGDLWQGDPPGWYSDIKELYDKTIAEWQAEVGEDSDSFNEEKRSISVYLDPGDAPKELIAEFYTALDALYRTSGGSGLIVSKDDRRVFIGEPLI